MGGPVAEARRILLPLVTGAPGSLGPRLAQAFRCRVLDLFVNHFPLLGNEPHYALLVPLLGRFAGDQEVLRMCLMLPLAFFITNAVKDLLRLPRPTNVPKLESEYLEEYGFPSTHTAAAVVWGRLLAAVLARQPLAQRLPPPVRSWAGPGYVVLIMFVRSYLGVHSLADLGGGLAIGAGTVTVVDRWLLGHAAALVRADAWGGAAVAGAGMVAPCLLFPDKRERTTFKDLLTMAGLTAGTVVGMAHRLASARGLAPAAPFAVVPYLVALAVVGLAEQAGSRAVGSVMTPARCSWAVARFAKYAVMGVVVGWLRWL